MTDSEMLLPPVMLRAGERRNVTTQEVWLLAGLHRQPILLELSTAGRRETQTLEAGWQGLLLIDRAELTAGTDCHFLPVRLAWLMKLLAFIDEARALNPPSGDSSWVALPLRQLPCWHDRRQWESWFLHQALDPSPEFDRALTLLRRAESYWLIRFLLAQSVHGDKLKDLGDRYGVSNSHFRRLCRNALGGTAKSELRDWRMARSLLDVMERGATLTEIALRHGYSSSSHFSNEIRDLLGVSPRGLSNIIFQQASK